MGPRGAGVQGRWPLRGRPPADPGHQRATNTRFEIGNAPGSNSASAFQRRVQGWHGCNEGRSARSPATDPAVGERRGSPECRRVSATEPDRRAGALTGTHADCDSGQLEDLARVADPRVRPQGADQLDRFDKVADPLLDRNLERRVLLDLAEADTKDCPARAEPIERGDLLRNMDRMIGRQYEDTDPEPNGRGDPSRPAKHGQRVETLGAVEGVVANPQILEANSFGSLRHLPDNGQRDRVYDTMRQRHTHGSRVGQNHVDHSR
jgi:hypothetical protein